METPNNNKKPETREDKVINICNNYREFLEIMKIEFGDFLRLAELGRTVLNSALKARKKSVMIRDMLKKFRNVSIDNDKRVMKILAEAKSKIDKEIEN